MSIIDYDFNAFDFEDLARDLFSGDGFFVNFFFENGELSTRLVFQEVADNEKGYVGSMRCDYDLREALKEDLSFEENDETGDFWINDFGIKILEGSELIKYYVYVYYDQYRPILEGSIIEAIEQHNFNTWG